MGRNYSKELVDSRNKAKKDLANTITHFVNSMESALDETKVRKHFAKVDERLDEENHYPNNDFENIPLDSEAYYGD